MAFISIYQLANGDVEISILPCGDGDRFYMRRQKINPPAGGMIYGIPFEEFAKLSYCTVDADGKIVEKRERYTGLPLDETGLPAWVIRHDKKSLDE